MQTRVRKWPGRVEVEVDMDEREICVRRREDEGTGVWAEVFVR